jgi:hypothetical protein
MRTGIPYRFAMIFAFAGILYACNKSNSSSSNAPGTSNANLQVQADDESRVSNETDAVTNDVNLTMSSPGANATTGAGYRSGIETAGANPITSLICDATVTLDTTVSPRTITITYNGSTNCSMTRVRTGVVVITLPAAGQRWSTAGAQITVSIQNLKITRLRDNKTITLNGTHVYTNVSGGRLAELILGGAVTSITHTIIGDSMQITFDDGSQRYWNAARQRVYTYNDGYVVTTTGLHSDATNQGIVEWGTTRYGNTFETLITSPMVISQSCSFRLTSGAIEILRPDISTNTNITFGLDSTGKATSCPGTGSYYYQAVWQGPGGRSGSVILPY